jgi:hypothetical protein
LWSPGRPTRGELVERSWRDPGLIWVHDSRCSKRHLPLAGTSCWKLRHTPVVAPGAASRLFDLRSGQPPRSRDPACLGSYAYRSASAIGKRTQDAPRAVSVAANLGMALAQDDRQALYLRIFFRLLSSWVHRGEIVESFPAPRFLLLASTPLMCLSVERSLAKRRRPRGNGCPWGTPNGG